MKSKKQIDVIYSSKEFSTAATGTPALYGLTPLQASGFAGQITDVEAKVTAFNEAKTTFRAASEAKAAALAGLTKTYSQLSKIAHAFPGINDTLLADAGLTVPQKPAIRLPKKPTGLLATTTSEGQVFLKWNRAGNAQGVPFMVEQASDPAGAWTLVTTTLASKAELTGYTPGVPMYFRVVAVNRNQRSVPSAAAVIYATSETVQLKIAA